MQNIPLNLAEPGMKLAKAITDESGLLLCGKGTELTETTISRISSMGINKITVEGHPVEIFEVEEKPPEVQLKELEQRFEKAATDPVMSMIKNMLEKKLKEKMEQKE